MDDQDSWRGVVIAEALRNPRLINGLAVSKARITDDGQPIDEDDTQGRWHPHWVEVCDEQIDRVQAATRRGWYAHFWRGNLLRVIYEDARFEMHRDDASTWQPAINHGLQQGLRLEWLDFPTDESAGPLA